MYWEELDPLRDEIAQLSRRRKSTWHLRRRLVQVVCDMLRDDSVQRSEGVRSPSAGPPPGGPKQLRLFDVLRAP